MPVRSLLPLDNITSSSITLPDGRNLGYAEYGISTGQAIICLHGLPGSRIDYARFDETAKAAGAHIVAIDRPGIGLSSPDPKATMLSIAADTECLSNALNLAKYAILGGSAGGPYALACAAVLPKERLRAVALVCSPGKSTWLSWLVCQCLRWMPSSIVAWHWRRDPGAQTQLSLEEHFELLRSLASKSVLHDRELGRFTTQESLRIWLSSSREAFKNQTDAVVQDTYRLATEWGFRMDSIDVPVRLWYGKFDGLAPVTQGEDYAAKLGDNACLKVLDETHGSMFANQSQCIIADLVTFIDIV